MTGQWFRFIAGATLTLSVAGHALAEEGKVTVLPRHRSPTPCRISLKSIRKRRTSRLSLRLRLHRPWRDRLKRARRRICLSPPTRNGWITRWRKSIDTASRATLLGNSLVVVAPKASAQGDISINDKTDWTSLLKGGRLAVGDPAHVPAGIYAKEALQKLGPGRRCRRSWLLRKTCAARWPWLSAAKRRWGSCTALMRSPARA